MKCFAADIALVRFVSGMCQPVALVVTLLVESFTTDVTNEGFDALMYAPVRVECR